MVNKNLKNIQEGRDKIMKIENTFLFNGIKLQSMIVKKESLK